MKKGLDVTLLRKRIGMVFQKPNPFPMSVYDNVAYGPRLHGVHSKKSWMPLWNRPCAAQPFGTK